MNREQRFAYYQELAEGQKHTIEKLTKKIYFTGTLRLVVFIFGVGAIYLLHRNIHSVIAISILFSILFILLLKKYTFLNEEKRYAAALLKIAEDELKAFNGDYSAFDGAPEQVDASHDFSFDLDIFGERSVFQLLNRTALEIGKERLCDFVKKPLHTSVSIKERQEAVKELALLNGFCLNFRKTGSLVSDGFSSQQQIAELFTASARFPYRTFWQIAIYVVPLVYIVLLALVLAGMVSANSFILLYISTLILSVLPSKNILRILQTFNKKNRQIGTYAQLFKLIENTPFKSAILQKLHSVICEPLEASKVVAKLDTYYRNLDVAFTPALFILNPLLLFNVRYALKINKWMHHHAVKDTQKWFDVMATFDALISLGTLAFNNPDYIFPETVSETFRLEAQEMGHPLILREKCIKNDVIISGTPYFMIITGANMAGKSTYLRTIGVNHLLASIGLPVFARNFVFTPGKLLTNLRTADSLVNSESYFFSELKRLKMIIERLKTQEEGLFVILDEILKGTNSEDKQKGSFALMRRFVKLGGNGIIATHDLSLGALETEFPQAIRNYHFDADISNDTLSFTYQIHEGVARNMNASFLMKNMGIVE